MCWRTSEPIFLTRIKAKADIPVFKICKPTEDSAILSSYFLKHKYTLNKVYSATIVVEEDGFKIWDCSIAKIYEGFHSFTMDCAIANDFVNMSHIYVSGIDKSNLGWYGKKLCVRVNGYIPKGSEYYVNEHGECVSSSICLTEIKKL